MSAAKSLARIEAFSDGVFAIAITLLIIEIKVPHIDHIHSTQDLVNAILHLWPSFFAFVYAFGGILVQWVVHHNILSYVDKTSRQFLYANGFLLFSIVFYPFPTALLAEYINTEYAMPAIVFYGVLTIINSFSWFLFIRSINKPKRLLNESLPAIEYNNLKASNHIALGVYIATTVLAIWAPFTALAINFALWAVWIYLSLMDKEKKV